MNNNAKACFRALCLKLAWGSLLIIPMATQAQTVQFELPDGEVFGRAFITFNQPALATVFNAYPRTDTKGLPITDPQPTSNTSGNRFLYVDSFINSNQDTTIKNSILASDTLIARGTADPIAVQQWRVFDQSQSVPLTQPQGGFEMPVDSLKSGVDWGGTNYGWTASNINPDPNARVPLMISLGGSFRLHSDFVAPTGALWFNNLTLQTDSYFPGTWFIGDASGQGVGSIFELVDPVIGVSPLTGRMTMEADFKWGNSDWSGFFRFGADQSEKIMGHISLNPDVDPTIASVPVPASIWLFGSALAGLLGFKRRIALLA